MIALMLQQMSDQAAQHQASMATILRQMSDNSRVASEQQDRAIAALNAAGARGQQGNADQLVDTRGISKPPTLTGKVAKDITQFKIWRVKYSTWIRCKHPGGGPAMKELEEQTQTPVTHIRCRAWENHYPQLAALSVHLYYTMLTTFEDEPWEIINQTPAGA